MHHESENLKVQVANFRSAHGRKWWTRAKDRLSWENFLELDLISQPRDYEHGSMQNRLIIYPEKRQIQVMKNVRNLNKSAICEQSKPEFVVW